LNKENDEREMMNDELSNNRLSFIVPRFYFILSLPLSRILVVQ
jgi:hypothetical protein